MNRQNDLATFALGLLTGAGLMFLLDPDRGRRRRALLRDRVVHGTHEIEHLGEAASGRARDLRNRTRGIIHETRARLRNEVVDDPVLEARIRTELGRLVSSPGAVEVSADHGRVTLGGYVLSTELDALLTGLESVRGVRELVNRLQTREAATDIADLQGSNQ